MRDTDLFQMALGLSPPWKVVSADFDPEAKRLVIGLDFPKGATFACPDCGQCNLTAFDTTEKSWRHLNFFQHEAYLTARVPRVKCPDCGVRLVDMPWARPGSGFTLLFEAMIMTLAKAMPVKTIGAFVNEHDTRLWRIIHHYVDIARSEADYSEVTKIGIDETASKRGHNYVSLFVDIDERRIIFATEGKSSSTVKRFRDDLIEHNGAPDNISEVCCDMSPAFIKGVEDNFEKAELTFDKFHIMKVINEAVDKVRRQEQKERPELRRTRYIWLKNPANVTLSQFNTLKDLILSKINLKTSRAFQIKLNFQELFEQPRHLAEAYLKKWYFWATHSHLEPIKQAAYTIKRHWSGILRWFESSLTNGLLEGLNSLIQTAKARARGFRTTKNLIAIIYLVGGKLDFRLPT
jgi:transposase